MKHSNRRTVRHHLRIICFFIFSLLFTNGHSQTSNCEGLNIRLHQDNDVVCSENGQPITCQVEEISGQTSNFLWQEKPQGESQWRDISTENSILLLPSVSTDYRVMATQDDCQSAPEEFSIKVRPAIKIELPADTTVCEGANLTIKNVVKAGEPNLFYWDGQKSDQASHTLVGITDDIEITLMATDGVCSTETKRFNVYVEKAIKLTLSEDQYICKGEEISIRVRARGGAVSSYKYVKQEEDGPEVEFSPEERNIIETPLKTTTYTVTANSEACESVTQQTTVFVDQPQSLRLTTSNNGDRICKGTELRLDVATENCDQLQWEMSTTATTQAKILGVGRDLSKSIVLEENATFRVLSLKESTCPQEASNEITVYVDEPPLIKIKPMAKNYCANDVIQLNADLYQGKFEHLGWTRISENGATEISNAPSCEEKATTDATYVVWAQSSTCPTASDTIKITVENLSTPTISISKTSLCAGDELTLNGTYGNAASVKWQRRVAGDPVFKSISTELTNAIIDKPEKDATYCLVAESSSSCPEIWSDPVKVTVEAPISIQLEAKENACQGETILIQATTNANANQLKWERINSNGSSAVRTNSLKVRESIEETSTYTVKASSELCPIAADSITIKVTPIPAFSFETSTDSLCEGDELTLSTDYPDTENIIWEESPMALNSFSLLGEGKQEYVFTPTSSAKYRMRAVTPSGCEVVSKPLSVNLSKSIINNLHDTTICIGNQLNLSPFMNNAYRYEWSLDAGYSQLIPNSEITALAPTEATTYHVRIKNGACQEEQPLYVDVVPFPNIAEIEITGHHSIRIIAEGGTGVYSYNFGHGFKESNSFENVRYSSTYKIQVKDAIGCVTDTIIHTPDCEIEIPHFFTPNGDGENDLFIVKNLEKFLIYTVSIYDRHGKLICQLDENSEPWDGTYNGKALPSDDYWYIINIEEQDQLYTGHFTLLR